MVAQNTLLERLASGGAVGSYWLELGSIAAAEVIAAARPDAIIFDTQHGLWDKQTLFGGFAAIRGKSEPVVCVADDGRTAIGEAYDSGAAGVIVPLVETAAQARSIVAAAKYPPSDGAPPAACVPCSTSRAMGPRPTPASSSPS